MEAFLAQYFELGLDDCELDVQDDTRVRIMNPGKFTISASLNSKGSGGILSRISLGLLSQEDKWNVQISISSTIPYELQIDMARYLTKKMDVSPEDIFKTGNIHTIPETESLADVIRCMANPSFLQDQLRSIIHGYVPVRCQDAYITTWRKDHPDSFQFVMNILLRECFSGLWIPTMQQTLKPLPEFITQLDASMFTRICTGLNSIREIIASDPGSDESSIYRTSWLGYEVLRCALLNFNVYSLVSVDSRSVIGTPDIGIYKVNYNNPAIYEQFDGLMSKQGHMAYHGSSIMNWYSIMYNGLFVAKDSLIRNGAASGTGIYLSNHSSFSLDYCTKLANHQNSTNLILGIFQVKETLNTYMKTTNIYVVPEESSVCLRYLIYMKRSNCAYNITNALDRYFINGEMVKEVSATTAIIDKVWSRRVMSEIRELDARDGIMGDDGLRYSVIMDNNGDNMNIIHLLIYRDTFCDCPLGKDMDSMGIEYIKMEVRLPGNYPFEPPFIRVLSPKFAFRKGHITTGGSVCIDLLTKQRWVPSLNIPNIMITVVQNMISGDARLEPGGKNYVYSLYEAQQAFTRMLSTHSLEWSGSGVVPEQTR